MFLFRKPSESQIHAYLARQAGEALSYDGVGCTGKLAQPRAGWNVDRHRVLLGGGHDVFRRGREAIESWQMFPREVATLCWPAPPREGLNVAVLYWAGPVGLWLLLAARVVYVVNETVDCDGREVERFGFAYGTLPDHAERGEERFLVEWDRRDDCVWYDLLAVSRPRHWLARVGYPYTRYEQARFRRLSGAAMEEAVRGVPAMGIRR
jgi:uncharacterized protein (UPF0548 family)